MIYNILNGDSLAYAFPDTGIDGELVIFREALVDGDLSGDNLRDFWITRAKHIGLTEEEYNDKVVKEFNKIMKANRDSEFNLWFEYDLFCQVNMWFIISIINSLPVKKKTFAVYTSYLDRTNKQFWNGFGAANSDELKDCFYKRIYLTDAEVQFGSNLWKAFKITILKN